MTNLVGILNITPDSFSDGGAYLDTHSAVIQAEKMLEQGAAIIDIGAESTRPGAMPLSPSEEWLRLEPVLRALPPSVLSTVSIDTRHPQTAANALVFGVAWINDVSGFPQAMIDIVRNSSCKIVVMHSLSVPADKTIVLPENVDVAAVVRDWFVEKLQQLEQQGISADRIIFDPGIGFGKTAAQSLELIRRAKELRVDGTALMFGHSRKSFLLCHPEVTRDPSWRQDDKMDTPNLSIAERDEATCKVSAYLTTQGVDYLRVHNVAANAVALGLAQ